MKMMMMTSLLLTVTIVHAASIRPEVPKAGFSRACRGGASIADMTKQAEIVTEAVVVEVSPPRDNVYAVTLQVIFGTTGYNILTGTIYNNIHCAQN